MLQRLSASRPALRAAAVAGLLAALVWPAAAQEPGNGTPATNPPAAAAGTDYRIGVGDVLEIAVWRNETMTRTVPVRPDGRISLPLVNDVPAAGLTPAALRDSLTAKLSAYIAEPVVSVIVREVNSFKASVVGQVRTPGRIDIVGQVTVLDAIAQAGGLTEFASRGRIVLLREERGVTRRIPIDYNRIVDGGGMDNYTLQPGDIIVVP